MELEVKAAELLEALAGAMLTVLTMTSRDAVVVTRVTKMLSLLCSQSRAVGGCGVCSSGLNVAVHSRAARGAEAAKAACVVHPA